MTSTQQITYDTLKAAAEAKNGSIKWEKLNYDGSYTVHLNAPGTKDVLCVLIKVDGSASRSWLGVK